MGAEPAWLDAVRDGDFAKVPRRLDWDSAAPLVYLINGYAAAERLGWGDLRQAAKRLGALDDGKRWQGTAIELWCFLFHEYRRYRHGGWPPEGKDRRRLDRLSGQLRGLLKMASGEERRQMVALMEA